MKHRLRYWLMACLMIWIGPLMADTQEIGQDAYVGHLTFVDLNGKKVRLADFKGKFVVVNFWATWCPPCLVEIPDFIKFHEAHKNRDAIVLGVNYETLPVKKLKAFIESQKITYPIVRLPGKIDGVTTPFGSLMGLPTTYMIDPQSRVVAMQMGMIGRKSLENFIARYKALHPHMFQQKPDHDASAASGAPQFVQEGDDVEGGNDEGEALP